MIRRQRTDAAPNYSCYMRLMPAKKTVLTDRERAKRIRATAQEIGTDNDPKAFERAFKKVVPAKRAGHRSQGDA
jgi:hypothetical protein